MDKGEFLIGLFLMTGWSRNDAFKAAIKAQKIALSLNSSTISVAHEIISAANRFRLAEKKRQQGA